MEIQYTQKEIEHYSKHYQEIEKFNQNPTLSIGICIERWAKKVPKKKVLFFEDKFWTWQTLNEETNKIANFFLNLGLKPGETIGLMMENSPEFLFVNTGINKIQGICSLININQRKRALIHAVKITNPKYFVVDGDCLPAFKDVFEDLYFNESEVFVLNNINQVKHAFIDFPNKLKSISDSNPTTTLNSKLSDINIYIFTSGTTGLPKAVILKNIRMGQHYSIGLQMTPDDIIYSTFPLYHSHSNGCWRGVVYYGAAFALRKRFSTSEFWRDISKFKATGTLYIGEVPRYLLNRPTSEYVKNTTLKKMMGLGLRKDIWERFKSRFNIERIFEFYGSTEGLGGFANCDELPGMIGRLIRPQIKIAKVNQETGEFYKDENGFCIHCKPGEIGMMLAEIIDESKLTLYKNKDNTRKKIIRDVFEKEDLYFNSGDLLEIHENLWVSFADRFGDTFRWKGENVSTMEIESILNTFPSIQICTVYGVSIPDNEGKAGMVSINPKNPNEFDISGFSRFVIENLPNYAIPIFIRIQDQFTEFTGTHKLIKVNLRKQGYNIEKIKDPILIWDNNKKTYRNFDKKDYQNLLNGKL